MDSSKLRLFASDPAAFRDDLIIDIDGHPVRFGTILDDWQRADFEALDAAWLQAIGRGKVPKGTPTRAYLERPRGHSKTTDLAVMATWALAFAPRQVTGAACAGDRDQAKLLRDAIYRIIRLNPWLAKRLKVNRYTILNPKTGSSLEVIASDSSTAYGMLLDFLLVDEVTNWPSGGESLWDAMVSTILKRSTCVCCVISNAGFGQGTSWQWSAREACRSSLAWHFSRQEGPTASWITEELLAEQRLLLPANAFNRLILNQWTTGEGDVIDAEQLARAVRLDGPMTRHEGPYEIYIAAVDIGLRNDRTAVVTLAGSLRDRTIALAHCQSWSPKDYSTGEVSLEDVEEAIYHTYERFNLDFLAYDAWEMGGMSQNLFKRGVPSGKFRSDSEVQTMMCQTLLQAFYHDKISLYDEPELLADLQSISIVEKPGGRMKLEAKRNSAGHADMGFAFVMALQCITERMDEELRRHYYESVGVDYQTSGPDLIRV